MHAEGGSPAPDALIECVAGIDHIAWAARNAKKVLGPRRVRGTVMLPEFGALLEYQPFGVIGVIGPWNYPVLTPMGSIAYALAAGNAVGFKPSEDTPAVGQGLGDRFTEIGPRQPGPPIVHGMGDVRAALGRPGGGKIAFPGPPAT